MFNSIVTFWVLVGALIFLVAYVLSSTYRYRNHKNVMLGGAAIVVASLAMSLFSAHWFAAVEPVLIDYVKNGFLMIASIGANLIAASVLMPKNPHAFQSTNTENDQSTIPEEHQSKDQ